MPLTLAHPAAILPLAPVRRFTSLSALVIGSAMPDVLGKATLSLYGPDQARYVSHSFWPGVFFLSVVVGWPIWLFFQAILKRPLAALLPDKITAYAMGLPRFGPLSQARGWELPLQVLVISASLILGATTHVVWDWFTHMGTPVDRVIDSLDLGWSLGTEIFTISGYTLYVHKVFQHVSSLLGLSLLAWCTWRWMRKQPAPPAEFSPPLTVKERVGVVSSLVFASCLLGVVAGVDSAWGGRLSLAWLRNFAGPAVWTTLIACSVLLAIYAMLWSVGVGPSLSRGDRTGER